MREVCTVLRQDLPPSFPFSLEAAAWSLLTNGRCHAVRRRDTLFAWFCRLPGPKKHLTGQLTL